MSAPIDAPPAGNAPTPPTPPPAPEPASDKGFPQGVALADMTADQREAYWKHYARTHEDTVKAFKGKTPKDVAAMAEELDRLRDDKLSADDKALKMARKEAADAAKIETEAVWSTRLHAAQLKAAAGQVIKDNDQLSAFLKITDPKVFVNEAGDVDDEQVIGHLTALFGGSQQQPSQQYGSDVPRHRNWGQYTPPAPPGKPGEGGRAEAQRRYGKKT